jgi:hypothetical protein
MSVIGVEVDAAVKAQERKKNLRPLPACQSVSPQGVQCGHPAGHPNFRHSNGTLCLPWDDNE